MIKVRMMIPVADNEGNTIDQYVVKPLLREVLGLCGGYTVSPPNLQGAWLDGDKVYYDTMYALETCCKPEDLSELRHIASKFAYVCKQECIYFEWHEVNVDFVTSPEPMACDEEE